MSFSDLLSDIRGDVESSVDLTHVVSVEDQTLQLPTSEFKLTVDQFDKSVIEKFNNLYQALTLKNSIQNLNKVDRQIAQEVFTMLPEVTKVEQAKVTSFPSVMNKEVVDRALQTVVDVVPEESAQLLKETVTDIKENQERINEVHECLVRSLDILKTQWDRHNNKPPIVIDGDRTIDLFNSPFADVCTINDGNLDYEKYAGTLVSKFEAIVKNESLKRYVEHTLPKTERSEQDGVSLSSVYSFSLRELTQRLMMVAETAKSHADIFDKYILAVNAYEQTDGRINQEVSDLVNQTPEVIHTLQWYKLLYESCVDKEGFLGLVLELLEFLD